MKMTNLYDLEGSVCRMVHECDTPKGGQDTAPASQTVGSLLGITRKIDHEKGMRYPTFMQNFFNFQGT
jgi:hypothetical protein